MEHFPTIDLKATGRRIKELREQRGISVRQLQTFLGLEQPRAIYKWQQGECLPSSDNLYAMACFFHVKVDEILVGNRQDFDIKKDVSCCVFYGIFSVCLLLDTSNTAKSHTPPRTDIYLDYKPKDVCTQAETGQSRFSLSKRISYWCGVSGPCSLRMSYYCS